jgi:hypothetical protein
MFGAARFHKRQAALPGRPQGLMTFDRLATGSFTNAAGAGRLDHWLATPLGLYSLSSHVSTYPGPAGFAGFGCPVVTFRSPLFPRIPMTRNVRNPKPGRVS